MAGEPPRRGAAYMHTGYYFGTFLAALVNYSIGAHYGWRAVFAIGGTPALLVAFIRYGVTEPKRWQKPRPRTRPLVSQPASGLLRAFGTNTAAARLLNALFLFISMVGLWAGSVYVPSSVTYLAARRRTFRRQRGRTRLLRHHAALHRHHPRMPRRCRRSRNASDAASRSRLYFASHVRLHRLSASAMCSICPPCAAWFLACLFLLGVGGANFAIYTLWLPEQYRTECRASAFAFATSSGRFIAAGITFLVGAGVARLHTIGTPVALTSIAF